MLQTEQWSLNQIQSRRFLQLIKSLSNQNPLMSNRKIDSEKTYDRISYETRVQLIKLVQIKKQSIKKASKLLKINYSTAKLIIRKYLKDGSVTKFSVERENKEREILRTSNLQNFHFEQQNQPIQNELEIQAINLTLPAQEPSFIVWNNPLIWNLPTDYNYRMGFDINWNQIHGIFWNF